MALATYHTVRRAYYYNFYPSRAEEEAGVANSSVTGGRYRRMLVEIRDVHMPPLYNPHHPWQIKKSLNHFEVASGKIIVSFNDTFQHILRYWNLCMANHLAIFGHRVAIVLWDFTVDKNPRKHKGNDVYFQITPGENYILTCMGMMRERNLKVGDKIGLYWDNKDSCFCVKYFY